MKKSIFSLALIFIGAMAFGQAGVSIGIKAGPNFANVSSSSDINTDGVTSFHGGAYANIKLLALSIQPEVLISSQGTQIADEELNLNYINVPVMVMFNLPLGLNVHAGPQFGFLTNVEDEDGTDLSEFYKGSDISLGLGAGWSISKFNVTARYLIGLSDINDVPQSTDELKNNVFQISLGFDLISLGN
jgi:hypothetical protein